MRFEDGGGREMGNRLVGHLFRVFAVLVGTTLGSEVAAGQSCPRPTTRSIFLARCSMSGAEAGTSSGGKGGGGHKLLSVKDFRFNSFKLQQLPMDPEEKNFVRRYVKQAIFSKVSPTPLQTKLHLVAVTPDVLSKILDIDPDRVAADESEAQFLAELMVGNRLVEGSTPLAHRYGGHQFGMWADQLGDGRAHLLGEYINQNGERWELQLKGSGMTPYSRDADGRAVLRSSVREFLASEAMFHLGVPTSRAGTLVTSNDPVRRDQFYDGHPTVEKATVVLRLAPSWFRFGSFEILAKHGEHGSLKTLADFIIKEHFPEIKSSGDDKYLDFLSTVIRQTAAMIARWQAVGFAHGVMNTDNMSILSISIDYGPYGFLDTYEPDFIPNHSDDWGRYAYSQQPDIGNFNLLRLAAALAPLISRENQEKLSDRTKEYDGHYKRERAQVFAAKLGFKSVLDGDLVKIEELLEMMALVKTDFTMTFRQLSEVTPEMWKKPCPKTEWALAPLTHHKQWNKFVDWYVARAAKEGKIEEVQKRMVQTNPRYVLRNWMAQSAIEKADQGNYDEVQLLLKILQNPFVTHEEAEKHGYAQPPPHWAHKIRVSCSS